MSGHSKWATTKRAKAITDAKKGAIFTKLANLITLSAKEKGGDVSTNFTLRMAIDKAKSVNMPKDNIERAIKRGTGELAGDTIEELVYEGFGPAKTQFIIKSLTDNKNRSAAGVRHLLTKYGGSMGSVAWNFDQKGVIRITKEKFGDAIKEDFELEMIDAGAQDIKKEEEGLTIYTNIEDLNKVKDFLDAKNIEVESAELEYVAKEEQKISEEEQEVLEKFIAELEENEDVSDYYSNTNI